MLKNNRMKVISLVMLVIGLVVGLVVGLIKDAQGIETLSRGTKVAFQCYGSLVGVFLGRAFFIDKDREDA